MKRLCVVVFALLSACAKPFYGSQCTVGPIEVVETTSQSTAKEIVEPFLSMKTNGGVITIGKFDAFRIMTARSRESTEIGRAVSMLRGRLSDVPSRGLATDAASVYPNLANLKGKEFLDGALISNEINVLFLRALQDGSAHLAPETPEPVVQIERYLGSEGGKLVRGIRVMRGEKRVFDYCHLEPQ